MSDVVLELSLELPTLEDRLASAIEVYAKWRFDMFEASDTDTPDIMIQTVRTGHETMAKKIIFPDRNLAAAFLYIWRREKRRPALS